MYTTSKSRCDTMLREKTILITAKILLYTRLPKSKSLVYLHNTLLNANNVQDPNRR